MSAPVILHTDGDGDVDRIPAAETVGWCDECERDNVPVIQWTTPSDMDYSLCRECIAQDEYVRLEVS